MNETVTSRSRLGARTGRQTALRPTRLSAEQFSTGNSFLRLSDRISFLIVTESVVEGLNL